MALAYEIELEQHQHDFIHSPAKFTVLSGGYGSGKTYAIIFKAIHYALKYTGIKIIICAETFPLLRDTIYRDFISICPDRFIKGQSKIPLNILFKNGSEVYFRSFDKEWKPKSFSVGAIFVEELTTFKEATHKQLRGRLRQSRKPTKDKPDYPRTLDGATNPAGFWHWVWKTFIDPVSRIKNCNVIHSRSFDNSYLPKDYIEDLKTLETTSPEYYKRNVLGEWGQLEGLIYSVPQELRKIPEGFEPDYYIAGLDFGFIHPSALSVIGVSSGRYGTMDEWYKRKVTSKDIIEKAKEMHKKYRFSKIYCDSARPEIIEEMVQAGLPAVPCIKGPGSVFARIMFKKSLIDSGNYFLSPECVYHIRETDSYIWDKSNPSEAKTEKPLKIGDDCMDSEGYAIYTHALENGLDVPVDQLYEFQRSL